MALSLQDVSKYKKELIESFQNPNILEKDVFIHKHSLRLTPLGHKFLLKRKSFHTVILTNKLSLNSLMILGKENKDVYFIHSTNKKIELTDKELISLLTLSEGDISILN